MIAVSVTVEKLVSANRNLHLSLARARARSQASFIACATATTVRGGHGLAQPHHPHAAQRDEQGAQVLSRAPLPHHADSALPASLSDVPRPALAERSKSCWNRRPHPKQSKDNRPTWVSYELFQPPGARLRMKPRPGARPSRQFRYDLNWRARLRKAPRGARAKRKTGGDDGRRSYLRGRPKQMWLAKHWRSLHTQSAAWVGPPDCAAAQSLQ